MTPWPPLSPIVIFDLPADHGTSSSHPLPQEPQETGSCDPAVCAAMERPITAVTWQVSAETDATMWALFSNKFHPRGPWEFHTGHTRLRCLKMHGGVRFHAKTQDHFVVFCASLKWVGLKKSNRWGSFSLDLGDRWTVHEMFHLL